MSCSAKIIADSISETGKRLTTFEITFPRIVLAEFNTHRMFSRNSASSRAIPIKQQIKRVQQTPFVPERFPLNDKGMQPNKYITLENSYNEYHKLRQNWLKFANDACDNALFLYEVNNIHKQIANRLLEPFMWHTVIVTATEFDNFFKLRTDENAQYEIRRIADLMYELYHNASDPEQYSNPIPKPKLLKVGEWHLPFISDEDEQIIDDYIPSHTRYFDETIDNFSCLASQEQWMEMAKRVSVARCARVSYLTHDGKRDIKKDLELFERLRTSGHYSPFEHVATPDFDIINEDMTNTYRCHHEKLEWNEERTWVNRRNANFVGWKQFRQDLPNENCEYFRKENK